jgi:drug/metabolite transporter (DMT)-like permease
VTIIALPRIIGSLLSATTTGMLAALGFVSIWAAWIVGTRHAVTHDLDPLALGFLRFAVPASVFAPVWLRVGLKPKGLRWPVLLALMGSGAPFFITVAVAMRYVPAPEVGPLLTGTMPVIVALLAVICLRETLGRSRVAGLICIGAGIAAIAGHGLISGGDAWYGHLLLICGAFMWASYTLAFRRAGLSPIEAAALISLWSALILAPFGIPGIVSAARSGFLAEVATQAIVQGVLSGVVAIVLYGVAIRNLGASRAAAFVALVPVAAALMGIPLLQEWPSTVAAVGITMTAAGVLLASGVLPSGGRRTG